MDYPLLMAAASGLAIGNSLFFGIYLWFKRSRASQRANRLLSLLLFALALRISKSVIIVAIPDSPDILTAIGLVGMAAIGPLLYLYLKSIHRVDFAIDWRRLSHFLPSILLIPALALPAVNEEIIYRFYQFVVLQMLAYLVASGYLHFRQNLESNRVKHRWGIVLLGGYALIWTAFCIQLLADTFGMYIVATTVSAFVLYGIVFWVMQNPLNFRETDRLDRINGNADQIAERIRTALEQEKLYRDPDLTIDKLAEAINSQSYLVSMVINERFQKSFPELVNSYRISKAREMLQSNQKQHLSVESIAYESGFNSISTFYSSFKKFCETTPAEYRKQFQS